MLSATSTSWAPWYVIPADHKWLARICAAAELAHTLIGIDPQLAPLFDYGSIPAEWTKPEDGRHTVDASGGGVTVRLRSDIPLGIEGEQVRGRHMLRQGEQAFCSLSWAAELDSPDDIDAANERLTATTRFWRDWLGTARLPDHRWREPIPS